MEHATQRPSRGRGRVNRLARVALAAVLLSGLLAGLLGAALASVDAGLRLVDQGDFDGALAAFEEAVASDVNDARAHYLVARAAVYAAGALPEGDDEAREALFQRAADAAQRATRLAPDDAAAHFEVARALGRLAQYRGVLQSLNLASRVSNSLDRTLELDPEHAGAWHALGLFHHDVPWIAGGRGGLVAPSFERAIAIEPDEITHRLAFARVLVDRRDEARALEHLRVAVTLRASTYLDRQDLQAARELLAELE
ncbi:MAG: hypothetical protein EA416_14615 [Trueperaceae bacterium]|nr:MAG: hypothetical protein EA416_14615 [Trueperaceae bacterium]